MNPLPVSMPRVVFGMLVAWAAILSFGSRTSHAQYVYGRVGQTTPPQTLGSGLELFESIPLIDQLFRMPSSPDEFIELSSDKRREDEKRVQSPAKKGQAKKESQKKEDDKSSEDRKKDPRSDGKLDKQDSRDGEDDNDKQRPSSDSSKSDEQNSRDGDDGKQRRDHGDELELRDGEPSNREVDPWHQELPRPRLDGPPRLFRGEMSPRGEMAPRGEMSPRLEMNPHGEPPRGPAPHMAPDRKMPDGGPHPPWMNDPRGGRPDGPPREHPHHDGTAGLQPVLDRLEVMAHRIANELERQDDGEKRENVRRELSELVKQRVELQHRLRQFELEMQKLEWERASAELELREESLDSIVETQLDQLLHH